MYNPASFSYRQYLDFLNSKSNKSSPFRFFYYTGGILFLILTAAALILVGIYQRQTPAREQSKYLQSVYEDFIATNSGLDEVLKATQIAGETTKKFEELEKQKDLSRAYNVTIEDLDRLIAKVDSSYKSTKESQVAIYSLKTPPAFESLSSEIELYQQELITMFDEVLKEQNYTKNVLYALGPSYFSPNYLNEEIWKEKDNSKIVLYYENSKTESQATVGKLVALTPPKSYSSYHQNIISYFEKNQKLSEEVLKTLSADEEKNIDTTNKEIAYQKVVSASKENSEEIANLKKESYKVFDEKRNYDQFAQAKLKQNAIEVKLKDKIASQKPFYDFEIPILIKQLF